MTSLFLNPRVLLVWFLFAMMLMAAGIWMEQPGAHDWGSPQYPRGDCGDNFFQKLLTPGGGTCYIRANSAEMVEREMQQQDPTIFDESIDYVSPERWTEALVRALKALGWE